MGKRSKCTRKSSATKKLQLSRKQSGRNNINRTFNNVTKPITIDNRFEKNKIIKRFKPGNSKVETQITTKQCKYQNGSGKHLNYSKRNINVKKENKNDKSTLVFRNVHVQSWRAMPINQQLSNGEYHIEEEVLESVIKPKSKPSIEYVVTPVKNRKNTNNHRFSNNGNRMLFLPKNDEAVDRISSIKSMMERQIIYQSHSKNVDPNLTVLMEKGNVKKFSFSTPTNISADDNSYYNYNNYCNEYDKPPPPCVYVANNRAYIKILDTDEIPEPKCKLKIRGDNYQGTFNIALDPIIDEVIYNTLKDLDDLTRQNNRYIRRRPESIMESCYTKLKSLFTTCRLVDKSDCTCWEKSCAVMMGRKRPRRSCVKFSMGQRYNKRRRRYSRKSSDDECTCLDDGYDIARRREKFKRIKRCKEMFKKVTKMVNKSVECCRPEESPVDIGLQTSKCDFSNDKATCEILQDNRDAAVETDFRDDRERNIAQKPIITSSDALLEKSFMDAELICFDDSDLYVQKDKCVQTESPVAMAVQPAIRINGKKISISTNRYRPKKEDLVKSKKERIDGKLTDTGIIDNMENLRIVTPYKIDKIEKCTTPQGCKRIEILFSGGQSITIITRYKASQIATTNPLHQSQEFRGKQKENAIQANYVTLMPNTSPKIIEKTVYTSIEKSAENKVLFNNKNIKQYVVASCSSHSPDMYSIQKNSKFIEINNFKPTNTNSTNSIKNSFSSKNLKLSTSKYFIGHESSNSSLIFTMSPAEIIRNNNHTQKTVENSIVDQKVSTINTDFPISFNKSIDQSMYNQNILKQPSVTVEQSDKNKLNSTYSDISGDKTSKWASPLSSPYNMFINSANYLRIANSNNQSPTEHSRKSADDSILYGLTIKNSDSYGESSKQIGKKRNENRINDQKLEPAIKNKLKNTYNTQSKTMSKKRLSEINENKATSFRRELVINVSSEIKEITTTEMKQSSMIYSRFSPFDTDPFSNQLKSLYDISTDESGSPRSGAKTDLPKCKRNSPNYKFE